MEFLKLWILKLTLKLLRRWRIVSFLTLRTHFLRPRVSQIGGSLGLSDEEMTDIAKHHLGLTNFKGVIPKDHIPVFTQYVIEAAPYEQSTVLINTAHDREPGKHWVALHYQPPTDYRACEDGCLVEYFDSYGVANLLPEINKFIEEVSPLTPLAIIL